MNSKGTTQYFKWLESYKAKRRSQGKADIADILEKKSVYQSLANIETILRNNLREVAEKTGTSLKMFKNKDEQINIEKEGNSLVIRQFYLQEESQGKGIAKQVLNQISDNLTDLSSIRLMALNEDENDVGPRVWWKFGFRAEVYGLTREVEAVKEKVEQEIDTMRQEGVSSEDEISSKISYLSKIENFIEFLEHPERSRREEEDIDYYETEDLEHYSGMPETEKTFYKNTADPFDDRYYISFQNYINSKEDFDFIQSLLSERKLKYDAVLFKDDIEQIRILKDYCNA